MKIWSKGFDNAPEIDAFTVGKDRELDLMLAPWDILGTMAHITMLSEVGLLGKDELAVLLPELKKLHQEAVEGRFTIEGEDVHSEVEARLITALGDVGKKVHTGRSRNDQVAVDIKLFTRDRLEKTVRKVDALFNLLQEKSEELKDVLMPGYTHLQVAMPSSFGLWLGAYAESLADDLVMLKAAWDVTDENPLGSAAGYGSSAPLNRTRTTELLGFGTLDYNSIYAQMSRGRLPVHQPELRLHPPAGRLHDRLQHHAPEEESGRVRTGPGALQPHPGHSCDVAAHHRQPSVGLFPRHAAPEGSVPAYVR